MRYKAGMVFHRSGAGYLETLESEFLKFPKGKNDDHVDMAAYAARLRVPVKSQQTAQITYEEDYSISVV